MDDCSLYGELLASKLRALSIRTRTILTNRIDNIVFETEMEELDRDEKSNYQNVSMPASSNSRLVNKTYRIIDKINEIPPKNRITLNPSNHSFRLAQESPFQKHSKHHEPTSTRHSYSNPNIDHFSDETDEIAPNIITINPIEFCSVTQQSPFEKHSQTHSATSTPYSYSTSNNKHTKSHTRTSTHNTYPIHNTEQFIDEVHAIPPNNIRTINPSNHSIRSLSISPYTQNITYCSRPSTSNSISYSSDNYSPLNSPLPYVQEMMDEPEIESPNVIIDGHAISLKEYFSKAKPIEINN